jgi:hypothetical protein
MCTARKTSSTLPVGWRIIENTDFVGALDAEASPFVERCIAEFKKLFGLYTKSDSQVVVMDKAPGDDALTRARTILHNRGYRNMLNWVTNSGTGRTVSLELSRINETAA